MLERVSPSAECAAHFFIRRIEAPIRSYRSLGRSFWRHGSDNIDVPVWWPAYLDRVRNRSHNSSFDVSRRHTGLTNPQIASRQVKPPAANPPIRTLTNSSLHAQSATAVAASEENVEALPEVERGGPKLSTDTIRAVRPAGGPYYKERMSRKQLRAEGRKKSQQHLDQIEKATQLDDAWKTFTRIIDKENEASAVLALLATGTEDRHLQSALQAFDYIPNTQRQAKDYDIAVDIATRLGRYSVAIPLIKEAVSRNLSPESFFKFLAMCVSKNLWNTAAQIWTDTQQTESEMFQTRDEILQSNSHDVESMKQNFAGRYITHFNAIPGLISNVTSLAKRLHRDDPVLAAHKNELTDLCKNLLLMVAESERIMALITSTGILSLLELATPFKLDSNLHFAALATLNQLPDKGARYHLAMTIYRNFKFTSPHAFIPKWVFKVMIGICSSGRSDPSYYRLLLEDYRQIYNTTERDLHLQVMRACASQGEVSGLYSFFEEFHKGFGIKHADDFSPMIRVHAVVGDYEQAQHQFDRIRTEFGLVPSVRNWNALILACSRSDEPEKAYGKFEEMKKNKIKPDQYSWSMMVALASKKGDTEQARSVIKQASQAGIGLPLAMVGALVDSCLLNHDIEEAEHLVTEATRRATVLGPSSGSPVRLWNSLFRYHAFRSDSEAILRTQERMRDLGVQADNMTYAALMTALVVQGRTKDATRILRTLHFNQALTVNEFHYSIIIHGFAMEKNRDLAQVMYSEMLERFPRSTPGAKLAMLYLQATRDEERARSNYLSGRGNFKPDFRRTLNAIKEVLAESNLSDLASRTPNPGFRRKTALDDMEQTFLGSLIQFLNRNHAHEASQKILDMLENSEGRVIGETSSRSQSWTGRLEKLSYRLEIATEKLDWAEVLSTWQQILYGTIQHCTSGSTNGAHTPQNNENAHSIDLLGHTGSQFTSMIFESSTDTTALANVVQVLPAHRYILSRPVSQYIKALDKQQDYERILRTVKTLRRHGFSLSSKNWNGLIQALCRSSTPNHQAFAFQLFDTHLLPNAPPWHAIRRGRWIEPSEYKPRHNARIKGQRYNRKTLEQLRPDLLMPTYFTMVHLALVWLNASRSSSQGDSSLKNRLQQQMARTVQLVLKTPYLKDKLQGALLRGRREIGDFLKQPRHASRPLAFAGIQSSRSLIDHLSPDLRADIESFAVSDNLKITDESLSMAEQIFGEIDRSPVFLAPQGRFESHVERRKRIVVARKQMLQAYSRLIMQVRKDLKSAPSLMGDTSKGQPPTGSTSFVAQFKESNNAHYVHKSKLYSQISQVLRVVGHKPLYPKNALTARKQRRHLRRLALGRHHTVRVSAPSEDTERLKARASKLSESSRQQEPGVSRRYPRVPESMRAKRVLLQRKAKDIQSTYQIERARISTEAVISRKRKAFLQRLQVAAIRAHNRASNTALRMRFASFRRKNPGSYGL